MLQAETPVGWELSESVGGEETTVADDPVRVAEKAGVLTDQQALSDFNATQRGNAKKWFMFKPCARMVVTVLCLQLAVMSLQAIEKVASDKWSVAQKGSHISSGAYRCRMLAAHRNHIHRNVVPRALHLLWTIEEWAPLSSAYRTWGIAGLAFTQV